MGLYFKFQKKKASNDIWMLNVYKKVFERIILNLNFNKTSKFILQNEFKDFPPLYEDNIFNIDFFSKLINKDKELYREKTGRIPHYSISVDGTIELENKRGEHDLMVVDINGTCGSIKDLYGNIWIDFYNTGIKWYRYFFGKEKYQERNRKKLYKMINDLKIPDYKFYSIFFAKSNVVFDLFNDAFYLYWFQYKYFISDIINLIKDKLEKKDLEYEELYIDSQARPLIEDLKKDFRLYNPTELVNLTHQYTEYLRSYQNFIAKTYKGNVMCTSTSSIEIVDKSMNPIEIRKAITDFIANFLITLGNGLIKYNTIEKSLSNVFIHHTFTAQGKEPKQKGLKKFVDNN